MLSEGLSLPTELGATLGSMLGSILGSSLGGELAILVIDGSCVAAISSVEIVNSKGIPATSSLYGMALIVSESDGTDKISAT